MNSCASNDNGSVKDWSMCSYDEAKDRAQYFELSVLECTTESMMMSSNSDSDSRSGRSRIRLVPHPRRCIKKYRRSAAGGGVSSSSSGEDKNNNKERSLEELECTVNYLLSSILPFQRSCPEMEAMELMRVVDFVEDRLRAVQVDVTKLDLSSSLSSTVVNATQRMECVFKLLKMEARIVRTAIILPYLLSDLSSKKYQRKFANAAISTAFSHFFAAAEYFDSFFTTTNKNNCSRQDKQVYHLIDEMISYSALCHLVSVVSSRETAMPPASNVYYTSNPVNHGNGISAIEPLYIRYCDRFLNDANISNHINQSTDFLRKNEPFFPKWQWTIQVASSLQNGNYVAFFRLLTQFNDDDVKGDTDKQQNTQTKVGLCNKTISEEERWNIIARCCVAQLLPLVRIDMMRQYNKCFGKLEKVSAVDLKELLHLPTEDRTMQFFRDIGLKTIPEREDTYDLPQSSSQVSPKVIMKAGPISITDRESILRIQNSGRMEDTLVFGKFYKHLIDNNVVASHHGHTASRVDADGVRVPPSWLLKELFQ